MIPPDAASAYLAALIEASDDAIYTADLQSVVTSWNAAAERLFGIPASDIVGRTLALLAPAECHGEPMALLGRVGRGERIQDYQTVRLKADGTRLPVWLTLAPVRGTESPIIAAVIIARPFSRATAADRAALRLAALVESSDDAIVSKDVNGIVRSWNPAAERMFGYAAAEVVGESIRVIIPADRQAEEDLVLDRIRRGRRVDHFETVRRRKDGSLVPISLTVSPIRDPDGNVIGASKIARDITDRKQAELERARLLADLQEHATLTKRLNDVGTIVTSALDRNAILDAVMDAATRGTEAEFGLFLNKAPTHDADSLLAQTFGRGVAVRIADLTTDPVYGRDLPFAGSAYEHRAVRSYMAVPVRIRSGEVLGGLFFGHSEPGRFSESDERLAAGIAAWAAIALENARLYVRAQEANRLKDEFLATLSHELRTPLNAILGYARMIRRGMVTGERQDRAVETIERNATSLTQIVEDVLDVSRIIAGKMRLNVQPVDLPELVRHAVAAVVPAADAKSIHLETVLDPRAAPVSGDPDRLQQVVWNLLSNAVKFTPKQGKVQVRVERVNSHVEIVVSDTGVGIAPEFLPHVFERFRQADAGITRERGGLGLGLEIARQVVEMHGGTIHASSGGIGQGSTFRVELPVMIVHPEVVTDERVHPLTRGPDVPSSLPDLEGLHVLAVDDDRDALGLVREVLEAAGARVSVADSATAAVAAVEAAMPDVIIADLGLPRIDGFELIAHLRRHVMPEVRRIPAAALTAYARSEDRARALRSGFQLHLAKPVDPSELLAAVAALAGRTGARQQT